MNMSRNGSKCTKNPAWNQKTAVQAHKDMVSKAKPNESAEAKSVKEYLGADIFKGLR